MMRLTAQEKKTQLLGNLSGVRRSILDAASSLPAGQLEVVFLGTWSLMDLLAHLEGWDEANLEGAQAVLAGRLPAFYSFIDKDWKTFNAGLVAQYKQGKVNEQLACVNASHRKLMDYLDGLPAADIFKDWGVRYKGYRVIIARLLQSEIDDERVHLEQINQLTGKDGSK